MMSASPWPPPPHNAAAPVPPPRAAQFHGQGEHEACPAHTDGVAQGDRAAVNVHPVGGYAEIPHRGERDRGERLVDLQEVQILDIGRIAATERVTAPCFRAERVTAERVTDGARRLKQQGRVGARHGAVAADLGKPRQSKLPGPLLAHDNDRAGPVRQLGRRSRRDRPVRAERGRQRP